MTAGNKFLTWAEMTKEIEAEVRDAARYRHLRELPPVQAQAFFWTYASRAKRDKAIDAAITASGNSENAQTK